ncbi:hypothetical protein JG687_00010182 [Phytophthora cactorum]|uniref:Protein kinase domain-containing protein n=1 Tax=Phytophthora cactorum TaxID=29920 RepID=A0A8T1UA74_9STRA|nr:hypothetical protein JG687_00010182 [Phytophthora cactorum]
MRRWLEGVIAEVPSELQQAISTGSGTGSDTGSGSTGSVAGTSDTSDDRSLELWLSISIPLVLLLTFIVVMFFCCKRQKRRQEEIDLEAGSPTLPVYHLGRRRGAPNNRMVLTDEDEEALASWRIDGENIAPVRPLGAGARGEEVITANAGIAPSHEIVAEEQTKSRGSPGESALRRFVAEIRFLATLSHPKIVAFYGVAWSTPSKLDSGSSNNATDLQMVLEFMSGGDLRQYLARTRSDVRARAWGARKLSMALDIAEALAYLHSRQPKPILHRDLKSRNILLDSTLTAKVADFGVSRYGISHSLEGEEDDEEESGDQFAMTRSIGTSRWIAPEVLSGDARYSTAVDIYSFGVILSELDSHELPFSEVTLSNGQPLPESAVLELLRTGAIHPSLSDRCPRGVAMLMMECLTLEPTLRPTAAMAAGRLRTLLERERRVSDIGDDVSTSDQNSFLGTRDDLVSVYSSSSSLSIERGFNYAVLEERNLDDSYATTAPAVSTRRDDNLFDIPIISTRRGALDSTCAVVDYDGGLISGKAMRSGDEGISVNANSSVPSEDGAIQKGSVEFVTCRHIGLLVSTLFAGVLNTCLKRGLLPLLQAELELETYQVDAANALMLLPWSYTFVWGFISDAFPLLGSRRKSYIIAGWVVSLLTCFAMAILNYTLEYNALSSRAATEEALQNRVALIDGYIGLLMLASFGGVLTLIIAETYVVAQTRREPLEVRGTALGTILLTQFLGELVGQIVSDKFIFNITEFGLTPIVSFRQTALFFMFFSLVPLIALVFFFHEDPDPPEIDDGESNYGANESHIFIQEEIASMGCFQGLRVNWLRLRRALAKESTIRVIRFFMIFVFLSEFTLTYPHAQLEIWCNFTDKAQSSSNITLEAFYVLAAAAWKYCALNCNWRYCVTVILIIIMMLPQLVFYFLATWSISMRSQETFTFMTALRGFMRAGLVILEVALSAEIAPVGGEGAFVGIIVSMSSIMRLLSTTFSNILGFAFEDPSLYGTDQQSDQVIFGLGICYSIRLISIVALLFLPRQKQELQRLHRFGAQGDKSTTWWVLGSLGCAFFISAIFNLLAIIPSTACLRIVGGAGCS